MERNFRFHGDGLVMCNVANERRLPILRQLLAATEGEQFLSTYETGAYKLEASALLFPVQI